MKVLSHTEIPKKNEHVISITTYRIHSTCYVYGKVSWTLWLKNGKCSHFSISYETVNCKEYKRRFTRTVVKDDWIAMASQTKYNPGLATGVAVYETQ